MLSMGFALRKDIRLLPFLEGSKDMCWDAVVGRRAISHYFLTLLFLLDNHIACITTNVNHIAEIAVGVVVVLALLFLMTIGDTLVPKRPLSIMRAATLVKILRHRLIFQLGGNRHGRWS